MEAFEASPKEWGNSLGITIPKEIVEKAHLKPGKKVKIMIMADDMDAIRKTFGTLKMKRPTQQIMDDIDEGWD